MRRRNPQATQCSELVIAVQHGLIDRVRELLKLGLDPNHMDNGFTLLHWAAQERHIDIVRLLFENGADINAKDALGVTPLYYAAGDGDLKVVETLVELQADVGSRSRYGAAIHNSVAHGHKKIVELLIANGADVNATEEVEGRTPIFEGVAHGHTEVVRLILAHGAKKDVRDNEGKLPIDEAKANGHEEIIRLLS